VSGTRCHYAVALSASALAWLLAVNDVIAQAEDPREILAVRVRAQGHVCDKAVKAERDPQLSRPDLPAWILECSNATYRVILDADMAARITRLDKSK
jgi:hypothetical protein